jgi:hypothetical protein
MYKVGRPNGRHYMLHNTADKLETNYHYYSDTDTCFSNRGNGNVSEVELKKIKQAVKVYNVIDLTLIKKLNKVKEVRNQALHYINNYDTTSINEIETFVLEHSDFTLNKRR